MTARAADAGRQAPELWALAMVRILSDLDRCQHGRHEGDPCADCGGPSHGNPYAGPGRVIGHSVYGAPIVLPTRDRKTDPAAWRTTPQEGPHVTDRVRTHIKAMIDVLKEKRPEELAQPAGLFISGMLTGLAASAQILDGSNAETEMERVGTNLNAAIGQAYLNGTLPTQPANPTEELAKINAILQDLGVEGELGARGMAALANTVRCTREELTRLHLIYEENKRRHEGTIVRVNELLADVARVEAERDIAYRERAHLVALLAAMTEGAVIAPAPDVDEPGWQIVYLSIGGHQASWHISPRDAGLVAHIEPVDQDDPRAQWDGHSTELKYARIAAYAAELAERCGPACAEAHTYAGRCEAARPHPVVDSTPAAPDVVHPDANPQASHSQEVDQPCVQHPTAPVIGGMCGGCTQYPTDMTSKEQPDAQQ
ncbi:hypothetical protein ACQEV9_18080 [Streptomyces chartreusis]|uniref:hypothetical protein n=1 Tax=Streptomyces chartreusis TaxID=1969 RepID=UPI003D947429